MPTMEEIAAQYSQNTSQDNMEAIASQYQQPQQEDSMGAPFVELNSPKIPDFLDSAKMFATAAAKGSLNFTANLMSLAEKGMRLGGKPEIVPRAYEYWSEKQKEQQKEFPESYAPMLGELTGEILSTPIGGALKAVSKGAQLTAGVIGTGAKTLAKYGTAGVGGGAVLTGLESQRFDPENPGQLANIEAMKSAASSPYTYVAPMLGEKLSTWAQASRKLGEAKEAIPDIMARQVQEYGAGRKFKNELFGAVPSITGIGKETRLIENIGDDVSNFITKLSGNKEALYTKDIKSYAGKQIQNSLKVLGLKEDLLWDKPFKTSPIKDVKGVQTIIQQAQDLINTSGIETKKLAKQYLDKYASKNSYTVEDVKNIRSYLGKVGVDVSNLGAIGGDAAKTFNTSRQSLNDIIQSSISPKDMQDYATASAYSAKQFKMFEEAPKLRKALESEVESRKLLLDLVSDVEKTDKKTIDFLHPTAKEALAATKLSQAMEAANHANGFNLGTFLDKTAENTQTPELLGSSAYKSLQGFNKYLTAINEGSKVGWRSQAALMSMVGLTGAGMMSGGITVAAVPIVSFAAASFVANHSPLKYVLNALTKNLPKNTYDKVVEAAQKHFTKAGFLLSEDGTFKHKDE